MCIRDRFDGEFESIEFKNVSFAYESNPEYVLKNVSFKINKNEKTAIVGYNGAGKSTLIKLILRLYKPTEGCLLYTSRCV